MLPSTKKTIMNLFPIITIDGIRMADFWMSWQITQEFKNIVNNFDYMLVQENDRWDTLAEQIYGDRQLWWILAIFNDIEDPFSIYFEKSIPNSIKKIKFIDNSTAGLLLNKIREKRLILEKQ